MSLAAAGGRGRRGSFCAEVGKPEEKRKPERFSGHRKSENDGFPRDIRSQCGNLITTKAAGKYLGLCPKATREFLEDVPRYEVGRKRCYMAIDLANKLCISET